jgi:hypothetical protein
VRYFWNYFIKQLIPILPRWNIQNDKTGETIEMINRTNNALECYNYHFNGLLQNIPTLIKFAQLVKQESRDQAEKLDNIHSGKGREVPHENVWVPDIPFTYG